MKKIAIFLILLVGAAFWVPKAHAQWQQAVEPTFTVPFYGIAFTSKDVGWVVGSKGTVKKTTDAGQTWTDVSLSTKMLKAVFFLDEKNGWIAGSDGTLLHTTDGGEHWVQSGSFSDQDDFKALCFSDEKHGWVVGSNSSLVGKGVFYRTVDGGANWVSATDLGGVATEINAVSFADASHGVLATKLYLYFTDDGGDHWSRAKLDFGGNVYSRNDFKAVKMVSPQVGYATGWGSMAAGLQPTILMKTEDGGQSWTFLTQTEPTYCYGYAMVFTDEKNGLIVGGGAGYGSLILKTTDGKNFTSLPIFTGNTLNAVSVADGRIWAAGSYGEVAFSDDGGQSWTHRNGVPDIVNYYAAAAPATKLVLAAGWNGGVIRSTDSGQSWSYVCVSAENRATHVQDLFFLNEKEGWACGSYGLVAKTEDGGEHWKGLTIGRSARESHYAVHFFDEKNGILCGKNSSGKDIIQKTEDGGTTWKTVQEDVSHKALYDLDFFDSRHGVAVGGDTTIFVTTDGGSTWKRAKQDYASKVDFYSVAFASPDNGWVVGKAPKGGKAAVLHSTDGGMTWSAVDLKTSLYLYKVWFQTPEHGWIVGKGGAVFETTDGGKQWNPVDVGSSNDLKDVAQALKAQPWIAGSRATLLTNPKLTRVEEKPLSVPGQFAVVQNYPNPFNPKTTIQFFVPRTGRAELAVFNARGQRLGTLVNRSLTAGWYETRWSGQNFASGIYFCQLRTAGHVVRTKLVLLK